MSDVAIRAEGLGKQYLIGHQASQERYVALRDVLARSAKGFARSARDVLRGRQLIAGDEIEEFWALRDINFEIKRGEIVGVIGRNGAGKSTLLKILSRITEPTEGRVEIRGRVASLLEVGTGFHPELSGRENIFLNGAILGMSRAEIRRKFDEIVAFAEVEKFLDTPVKRYSSGMYVRLAFAVAAHLEPEILVVDEVLAVGDAEFQKKCLGKMGEVAGQGRTVLFVSHNIGALSSLCDRGILLQSGRLRQQGDMQSVLRAYKTIQEIPRSRIEDAHFLGPLRSVKFEQLLFNGEPTRLRMTANENSLLSFSIVGHAEAEVKSFSFAFAVQVGDVRLLAKHDGPETLARGPFEVKVSIPGNVLRPGEYAISLGGRTPDDNWTWAPDLANIEIIPNPGEFYDSKYNGILNVPIMLLRSDVMKSGI